MSDSCFEILKGIFDQTARWHGEAERLSAVWRRAVCDQGARTPTRATARADGLRQKFTGYKRDTESGLDYAQARYYANMQGRFTSPDPFAGSMNLRNPQSFNRYTYVRNNPVKLVDPSGLDGAKFSMNSLDGNDIQNFINSQGDGAGEANVLADANDAMNEAAAEADAPPPAAPTDGDGTADSAQGRQDAPGDTISGTVSEAPETVAVTDAMGLVSPQGGVAPVSATGGPRGTVIITNNDGSQEVRAGGSRAWRNNNPGNIRPDGTFGAKSGQRVDLESTPVRPKARGLLLLCCSDRGIRDKRSSGRSLHGPLPQITTIPQLINNGSRILRAFPAKHQ